MSKPERGHAGMFPPSQEVIPMPTESLVVSVCVVAMFMVFAAVLARGDKQTRPKQLAQQADSKRRAF
jgi:hypothetical protein